METQVIEIYEATLFNIYVHKTFTGYQHETTCSSRGSTLSVFKRKRYTVMTASVWSEFLATDLEVRVRLPALPDFLRSSESGTGSTQSHEYN
jgi:hypothetical protein